jgi:uncharacterized protein YdgA (DUF945 family)
VIARALTWLVGLFVLLGGAWFTGKRQGALRADLDAAKDNIKTTERMQDADASMGDDPDALRDWLRDRDPNKR